MYTFDCSYKNLTSLPKLPYDLKALYCWSNQLNRLPKLPQGLLQLYVCRNQITRIHVLPPDLQYLNCEYNLLTSLPVIPKSVNYLRFHNKFLWNYSRNSDIFDGNKGYWFCRCISSWNNYKILNKLRRTLKKRKRRQYYLVIKDVVTNDLAGVICKYT